MIADDTGRARIADFIRAQSGASRVALRRIERMSGGAVQQNWALDAEVTGGAFEGEQQWVLRIDAPARVAESLTRSEEFRVLEAMQGSNVLAPRAALER